MQINITRQITVDAEIADEIYWLNEHGIITEASCSGHGKVLPTALIKSNSVILAQRIGYQPKQQYLADKSSSGLFEIQLQGNVFCSYILHETGQQPYTDTIFSAGVCEGHKFDSVYLKLEREEPFVLFLRRDEALSIINLLAGALWSEQMSLHEVQVRE